MRLLILIGFGSFIGGSLRYLLSLGVQSKFLTTFPIGTLTVNILGCFLIGIIFGLSERINLSPEWRLFLATGICGGFTTFSAFSIETLAMLKEGQLFYGFSYIGLSVILGLIAVYLGMSFLKLI